MPPSVQPSAGVSTFALDTAPAAVSCPSRAAARLRRGALRAPAAFEGLDAAAGAVSNANADSPAEGCALDGMRNSDAIISSLNALPSPGRVKGG